MPQGHLYAIARVFFVFLSMGLFGLSVGQSPSLSPLLSLSLSLSFPLPHALCAGRGEAHAELYLFFTGFVSKKLRKEIFVSDFL